MSNSSSDPPDNPQVVDEVKPKKSRLWLWLLGGGIVLFVLPGGGCFAFLMYNGTAGPEASVYAGNRVPNRFIKTMRELGALEEDETILFFAFQSARDIKLGFFFVSDKRIVIYSTMGGREPLQSISFNEIRDAQLDRDESPDAYGRITLKLQRGSTVSFPVSKENDMDVRFFEAIQSRRGDAVAPAESEGVPE